MSDSQNHVNLPGLGLSLSLRRSIFLWFSVAVLLVSFVLLAPPVIREWTSSVPRWQAKILASLPHDPDAITQGFELLDDQFVLSTGGYGTSTVRTESVDDGHGQQRIDLPESWYAEGVTVVDDRIWMLTWQEQVAVAIDTATFEIVQTVAIDGEGWGLCFDEPRTVLISSDGSSLLTLRDPTDLTVRSSVKVTLDGVPLSGLNELECVNGDVWANVIGTDRLVRIGLDDGEVDAVVDVPVLLPNRSDGGDLNGIAWAGGDRFWLTGKKWPTKVLVTLRPPAQRSGLIPAI